MNELDEKYESLVGSTALIVKPRSKVSILFSSIKIYLLVVVEKPNIKSKNKKFKKVHFMYLLLNPQ